MQSMILNLCKMFLNISFVNRLYSFQLSSVYSLQLKMAIKIIISKLRLQYVTLELCFMSKIVLMNDIKLQGEKLLCKSRDCTCNVWRK